MMTQQNIKFTKMHGLGNDFVVINSLHQSLNITKFSFPHLANRYIGIGFDQLLIIEPSKNADYFCRIYNADGSEAMQCGNGLRCIARYIHEENIAKNSKLQIETIAGIFPLEIKDYDHISVSMGAPQIKYPLIELNLSDQFDKFPISILSIGNLHAVAKVESIESIPINDLASKISTHSYFPDGVNVGFMQIMDKNHIRLRTFERGVGETLACGSNACAAVVAGIVNGWLDDNVKVDFNYGSLEIRWKGDNYPIQMTGPATRVYSGVI